MWTVIQCPEMSYIVLMVAPTLNFCRYDITIADHSNALSLTTDDVERERAYLHKSIMLHGGYSQT